MSYTQPTSPFWWTRNPATVVYFLRELTGIFIALYAMIFLGFGFFDPSFNFVQSSWFSITSWIALVNAILHTITWFWVTVKITPVPLPKPVQVVGFLGLLSVTAVASYFLLQIVYTPFVLPAVLS